MNKICVYTCITGDYDSLNEIKNPEKHIDYYCFTNNKKIKSKTWKIVHIENEGLDNVRLARKIKTVGHPLVNKHELAVWTDANIIWQKKISDFIATFLKDNPLVIFRHSARNNVHDEAVACFIKRKDSKEILAKTIAFLDAAKYPDNNGLCESTVYIKKLQDPKVKKTMEIWFDTIKKYSRRDQLSFNYAAWKAGLKFDYINLSVWDNEWIYAVKHLLNRDIEKCYIYYGDPNKNFNVSNYFDYFYKVKDGVFSFTTTIPLDAKEIEINPTNVIGTFFDNIVIKPTPSRIKIDGNLDYGNSSVFCTNQNVIKAYGDFKKGKKLSFSVKFRDIDRDSFDKILENAWIDHNKITFLQEKNKILQKQVDGLETVYNDILNSKSWRTLDKFRKVKQIFKKSSK